MRKLATIQKVQALHDIKEADFIELCQINGWQCITKKGEVKVGELVIYFEIDSFLPDNNYFSFLPKKTTYEDKQGYKLRTIKLKKVLSQGLVLPISHFKNHLSLLKNKEEGDDVTEILGIVKYDPESHIYAGNSGMKIGKAKGSFPSQIPKTNQERIQNLPHLFTTNKEDTFEETLKLDGSSMTCYKVSSSPTLLQKFLALFGIKAPTTKFGVCSRNVDLKRTANTVMTFDNGGKESVYDQSDYRATAIKLDLANKVPVGYAIQGELIGPKIQANHEKVTELQYYVFDVFNISEQCYLLPQERRDFCHTLGIPHVPVMDVKATPLQLTLDQLLQPVDTGSGNPKTASEGRAYKSNINQLLSFMVINNRYLLKNEA